MSTEISFLSLIVATSHSVGRIAQASDKISEFWKVDLGQIHSRGLVSEHLYKAEVSESLCAWVELRGLQIRGLRAFGIDGTALHWLWSFWPGWSFL